MLSFRPGASALASHGQDDVPRGSKELLAGLEVTRIDQGGSDCVTKSLEERERHSASDKHRVGPRRKGAQDTDLVLHLGPAENYDKRPLRLVEQPGENLHLAGKQASRSRGQVLGRAYHRSVGPV